MASMIATLSLGNVLLGWFKSLSDNSLSRSGDWH